MNSYRLHREYVGQVGSTLEPPIEFKTRRQAKREIQISKVIKKLVDSKSNQETSKYSDRSSLRQMELGALCFDNDETALDLSHEWLVQDQVRINVVYNGLINC